MQTSDSDLEGLLELKQEGWVGAGWAEVCIEGWEGVLVGGEKREFTFLVEGRSVLLGSVATTNQSFTVSLPSSPSSSRQLDSCDPSLWDSTPSSLYGIQTYPSGLSLLPPSLRSFPLTIITKALSPCTSIGMSKDILAPFSMEWNLMDPIPEGLETIDINSWANGGVLVIPSLFLEDRDAFPMNEPVGIQVIFI